jgi:hypothetical protein
MSGSSAFAAHRLPSRHSKRAFGSLMCEILCARLTKQEKNCRLFLAIRVNDTPSSPGYQFFDWNNQAGVPATPHFAGMKSVFGLWKRLSNERTPVGASLLCAANTPKAGAEAWLPVWRPWDGVWSDNRREAETINAIEHWPTNGDENSVKKWLSFHLAARDDDAAGRQGYPRQAARRWKMKTKTSLRPCATGAVKRLPARFRNLQHLLHSSWTREPPSSPNVELEQLRGDHTK